MSILNDLSVASTRILEKQTKLGMDRSIYVYGFELFYSTLFTICSIVIISSLFGKAYLGITFLLFFIPVRIFSGGYHAETYRGCFVCTNLLFSFSFFVVTSEENGIRWLIKYAIFLILAFYIWLNAPVKNEKVYLTIQQRKANKKNTGIVLFCEAIILLVFNIRGLIEVSYMGEITTFLVGGMIFICSKKNVVSETNSKN